MRRIDDFLSRHVVEILGAGWPDTLRCAVNRRLTPAQMADYAAAARLTLNIGRDSTWGQSPIVAPAGDAGTRTFEVALSGSTQASSSRAWRSASISSRTGDSLLVDGAGDIARAVERSLDEPEAIEAIARRAQARALREHTYGIARRVVRFQPLTVRAPEPVAAYTERT